MDETEKLIRLGNRMNRCIAPTVDVVPVRCKDCGEYYEYEDFDRNRGESYKAHECGLLGKDLGSDGFCILGWKAQEEEPE